MSTVIGAVEVRVRKDAEARAAKHLQGHERGIPLKKLVYAGRLRLRVIENRHSDEKACRESAWVHSKSSNHTTGSGVNLICQSTG